MFNELLENVHTRVAAERAGDLQREQDYRVRILSTLQRALELHLPLKWADGRDGTIDGVLPGRLEYDAPVLSFFGTAVWYDSNCYEDPLSIRIVFNPDVSGSVDTYAIRFGDADHGLRKSPYRNHSKFRYRPEPARWCYEFNKA